MKISLLICSLFIFTTLAYSRNSISLLFMETNGQSHRHDKSETLVKNWYSFSLIGDTAVVSQCTGYRNSDWLQSTGSLNESIEEIAGKTFRNNDSALALPQDALFAFHALDDSCQVISFPQKRSVSLLETPRILRNRWSTKIRFKEELLTIKAIGEKRKDKKLLAGSLALLAISENDTTVLMPPLAEKRFKRQELLWIGDLDGDDAIDAVIKRTLHTGETLLHFHIGTENGTLDIDEEYPYQVYSAGIEDYMSIGKHKSQKLSLKGIEPFGEKAFRLSNEVWNRAYGKVRGGDLPKTLLDYMLTLNGEKIRFTFDYTPRYRTKESGYNLFYGPSPAHITVHYRGRRQALIDLGSSDGDPVRIEIDTIDNKMAIRMEYMPHYNNSFTLYWIWSPAKKRFVKYMQYHAQGC